MPPEVIPLIPKLRVEIDGGKAYVDNEVIWYSDDDAILETVIAASDNVSHAGRWLFP